MSYLPETVPNREFLAAVESADVALDGVTLLHAGLEHPGLSHTGERDAVGNETEGTVGTVWLDNSTN